MTAQIVNNTPHDLDVVALMQGGDNGLFYIGQRERDEAAHTVSIWNSDKRGTGARRIVAVGIVKDGYGDTFTRRNEHGAGFSSNGHTEF